MMRCTDTGPSYDYPMLESMIQDTGDTYGVFGRMMERYDVRFEDALKLADEDYATVLDSCCAPIDAYLDDTLTPFSSFEDFRFSEKNDTGSCFEIACAIAKTRNLIKTIKALCGMNEDDSDETSHTDSHKTQIKESSDDNLGTDLNAVHCPYPLQSVKIKLLRSERCKGLHIF